RAHSYEATATILVGPAAGEDKTVQAASQLAESWAALATSRPLLDATARTLRLPPLTDALTAKANESTRLVTITARNGRPDLAAGGAFALLLLLAGARDPVRDAEHVRALTGGEPVALLSPHAGDQALLGAPAAALGPRSMLLVGTGDVDVAAVGRSLVAALAG